MRSRALRRQGLHWVLGLLMFVAGLPAIAQTPDPRSTDAVPPGAVPPGGVPPGAVAPGAVAPGAVAPGAVAPGAVPPGAVARSAVLLGGALCEVVHQQPRGHVPAPDLSRAGHHRLPREVRWRHSLPVLWGERVVPPGEYVLSVVVDPDFATWLELRSARGGRDLQVPLELGSFSQPAATLEVSVSSLSASAAEPASPAPTPDGTHTGAATERGLLLVRWGALAFLGEFIPVRSRVLSVGPVRLDGYDFPAELPPLPELALGTLVLAGDPPRQFEATLSGLQDAAARLILEDSRMRQYLDERAALQRALAALRASEPSDATEVRRLESRLRGVEARLEQLGPEQPRREFRGTPLAFPDGARGFALLLELHEDQPVLVVRRDGRGFRFVLTP